MDVLAAVWNGFNVGRKLIVGGTELLRYEHLRRGARDVSLQEGTFTVVGSGGGEILLG
jgi:hypothetical protein